jgi:UDP-N-acetylglucosamine diphosphorylase/glucosamine-1-phosphate N-acetyltransferase
VTRLVIVEDHRYDNLYPLTYMRPAFELRCGATTLAEKIRHAAGADSVAYFVRDWLRESYAEKTQAPVNDMSQLDGDVLFVNGRLLVDDKCDLQSIGADEVLKTDNTLIAARVTAGTLAAAKADSLEATFEALQANVTVREVDATVIDYPWLLIYHNERMIESDFRRLYQPGVHAEIHPLSCIENEGNVYIAPTAKIHPMVVIDATDGPVVIEDDVIIRPHTRVDGPTYIGPKCQLVGGKIREGCSFGPVCRVGGEVECTIIQGYSNKYHDGFLGHSYVCEWVNLGALTTNSDLKNDYSPVSVYYKGRLRDTGEQFLGSMIGDHTKTSIGIILNTGSVIGMMSNLIFSGSLMPKYVPSFCWMLNDRPTKGLGLRKMIETARASMARRKEELTEAEEKLIRHLHGLLKVELHEAIKKAFRRK